MKLDPKKYPILTSIVSADASADPAALAAKKTLPKAQGDPAQIEQEIKSLMEDMKAQVEELSQLRFQLSDLAEAGNEQAKKLYDGWTRVAHLYLSEAMEAVGNENAEWHAD